MTLELLKAWCWCGRICLAPTYCRPFSKKDWQDATHVYIAGSRTVTMESTRLEVSMAML